MFTQSVGQHTLFLTIHADEQRNQQTNATTVHILQSTEAQTDIMGSSSASLCISCCQYAFRKGCDFSLNVNNAGCRIYLANVHDHCRLGHSISPYVSVSQGNSLSVRAQFIAPATSAGPFL